jgi:hypothetical protein
VTHWRAARCAAPSREARQAEHLHQLGLPLPALCPGERRYSRVPAAKHVTAHRAGRHRRASGSAATFVVTTASRHPLIRACAAAAALTVTAAVALLYGTMLGTADRAGWGDNDTAVRVVERVETAVGVAR